MMETLFGENGWGRLERRAAERLSGKLAAAGTALGLICLDLRAKSGQEKPEREEPERRNGPAGDGDWDEWLGRCLPNAELWLGAEVAGHLWVCAEVPAPHGEADAALNATASQLWRRLFAGAEASGERPEAGGAFGCAALKLDAQSAASIRDTLYEAAVEAIWRLRQQGAAFGSGAEEALRREMERLIRDRSIRSVYQPIVRLGGGEVFGYEALTRCPADSLFDGPLALFGFAEKNGYAYALDRLAREKAIAGVPPLNAAQKIFINVTMGIMNDPRFVSGQTAQWLRQRGLRPGQVVFELTERSSIDDFGEAKRILRHYREQGYQIAIDDAGAGYSSLQSIVELRPDYIKVDRSLVRNADRDEMKKQMLRTFVRFAKRMDIRIVAEGIERPEELRMLRTLGIDYGQGYLLGRPGDYAANPAPGGLPGR